MQTNQSTFVVLVTKAIQSSLETLAILGERAKDKVPVSATTVGKVTDMRLRGDVASELAMFEVANAFGKVHYYCIHWFSEELGSIVCGDLKSMRVLTVTADGIDGTKNLLLGKECGPIITVASGASPKYKAILASAIGLIKTNEIYVADAINHKAYQVLFGAYERFHPAKEAANIGFDNYTTAAKNKVGSRSTSDFTMTDSTAWTITLVAKGQFALVMDAFDKFNMEQHAIFAFAQALGLIFETYSGIQISDESMLDFCPNPKSDDPEAETFYFVPTEVDKLFAIAYFS